MLKKIMLLLDLVSQLVKGKAKVCAWPREGWLFLPGAMERLPPLSTGSLTVGSSLEGFHHVVVCGWTCTVSTSAAPKPKELV
jgi:hypothetical protein